MAVPGTACERKRELRNELRAFVDRWSRDPSIKKIILFGSAARGDIRSDSDLDLIVVQETEKKFLARLEPFYCDAHIAMDILVYTPDEFAAMTEGTFLKNALQDGAIVYEAGTRRRRNRWLKQAESDLDDAWYAFTGERYNLVCFLASRLQRKPSRRFSASPGRRE